MRGVRPMDDSCTLYKEILICLLSHRFIVDAIQTFKTAAISKIYLARSIEIIVIISKVAEKILF